MADDTRQHPDNPPPPPSRYSPPIYPPPTSTSKRKYFDTSPPSPTTATLDTSANAIPAGSGQNTAGAHIKPSPTLTEGMKTIRLEDFKQVHMYPGVRESLLMGIGLGFAAGGIRFIFGGKGKGALGGIQQATNWAVGTFCVAGWANYEVFHYRRRLEKVGMKRVVEVMDEKRIQIEMKLEAKRAERRRLKEEDDRRILEEERRKMKGWRGWFG